MKAPRNVQRDHPHRTAPYRPIRRIERDIVPIHRQVFHRYQPLKAGNIETYRENLEDDAVLVHQQCFPVSLAEIAAGSDACVSSAPSHFRRSLSIERDPVHLDTQSGSRSEQDTSIAGASGPIHPASECTQPVCESEEISPTEVSAQRETKLHGVDSTVGRYMYEGDKPLSRPPSGLHAMLGDLFVQKHSTGDIKIWLWNNDQWLPDIRDGCVHPTLVDYRLNVRAGSDPTWVTCKTRATYIGKERGRNKTVAPGSRARDS